MARMMLGGLVLALACGAAAEDKKGEKIDPQLLVGKWKQVEPLKLLPQITITKEFTADGKLHTWIDHGDGKEPSLTRGTYEVAGDKLTVTSPLGENATGKGTVVIAKLTKDEFHSVSRMGEVTLKMKRVEEKK